MRTQSIVSAFDLPGERRGAALPMLAAGTASLLAAPAAFLLAPFWLALPLAAGACAALGALAAGLLMLRARGMPGVPEGSLEASDLALACPAVGAGNLCFALAVGAPFAPVWWHLALGALAAWAASLLLGLACARGQASRLSRGWGQDDGPVLPRGRC